MKLKLDEGLVEECHLLGQSIADTIFKDLEGYSTVSVERTVLRMMGIKGAINEVPLPNIVVQSLEDNNMLSEGVLYWTLLYVHSTGKSVVEFVDEIVNETIDFSNLKELEVHTDILNHLSLTLIKEINEKISKIKETRTIMMNKFPQRRTPLSYVLTATGNVNEDSIQGKAVARNGGDIIAVLRSTAQSLLDYVPYGLTTEGYGGTYATQENFALMRKSLDEVSEEIGHYISLSNFCSGLCMPEIAIMGAFERLDNMANDALYGIIYRDINMRRTLIDQKVSRFINGISGIVINTGEDNYLRTDNAIEKAHTVLTSNFINLYLALKSDIPDDQIALGHCMEMDPSVENYFLLELAQAQMTRQIFEDYKVKYMPPTKYMTGDIFKTHACDTLFNLISSLTHQDIETIGVPTEGFHTPHIADRVIGNQNAQYVFNATRDLGDNLDIKEDSMMQERVNEVIEKAHKLLAEINDEGLYKTLEKGVFGDTPRKQDGGKGQEGIFKKSSNYLDIFSMWSEL